MWNYLCCFKNQYVLYYRLGKLWACTVHYLSIIHTHVQRLFFPPLRIQLALMNCPTTICQWSRTYNHYEWSFQERQGLNIQVQSVHPHIRKGKENRCSWNPSNLLEALENVSIQCSYSIFLWNTFIHPLIQIMKSFIHFVLWQKYGTWKDDTKLMSWVIEEEQLLFVFKHYLYTPMVSHF